MKVGKIPVKSIKLTRTKITYNTDGLIASGSNATTSDIAESTDKRYVTDAQRALLEDTSNINTGDETKATILSKLGPASGVSDGYLAKETYTVFSNKLSSIVEGTNVTIDNTDPKNPIINVDVTSGVQSVNGSTGIVTLDTSDIPEVTNKHYVTDANLTTLGNTSNTNSGDETQSSIKTKLGSASTGSDGYLTSSGFAYFSNKVSSVVQGANVTIDNSDPLNPVISASGDVQSVNGSTGVVVLTTADIPEATNKNYVTDAAITVLGNTSGTNSGDQVADGVTITGDGTIGDPFVAVVPPEVSSLFDIIITNQTEFDAVFVGTIPENTSIFIKNGESAYLLNGDVYISSNVKILSDGAVVNRNTNSSGFKTTYKASSDYVSGGSIGDTTITLTGSTGFIPGDIISANGIEFYEVVSVSSSLVTIATPIITHAASGTYYVYTKNIYTDGWTFDGQGGVNGLNGNTYYEGVSAFTIPYCANSVFTAMVTNVNAYASNGGGYLGNNLTYNNIIRNITSCRTHLSGGGVSGCSYSTISNVSYCYADTGSGGGVHASTYSKIYDIRYCHSYDGGGVSYSNYSWINNIAYCYAINQGGAIIYCSYCNLSNISFCSASNAGGISNSSYNTISYVTNCITNGTHDTDIYGLFNERGILGGQTIIGSTVSNQDLNLRSNSADLTTGSVNFLDTLDAFSITDAGVTIAGGLSVAKRVYALNMTVTNTITGSVTGNSGTVTNGVYTTGNQSIAGIKTFSDVTEASNTSTGGTIISGGLAVAKRVYALDMTVTNTISGSVTGNAGTVTVADESTDTTCFPLFATAATGSIEPKTVASLTFNSNTGALSSTIINATSERSLKENIVKYKESALSILKETEICLYNFKTNPGDTRIGIIADDAHALISPTHKTVDLYNTMSLIIKAIQELNDRITKLENA